PLLDRIDGGVILIVIGKTLVAFGALLVSVLMVIWWERKLISFMQSRVGPQEAGPYGLLQSLADGIKAFFKEAMHPARADRPVGMLWMLAMSGIAIYGVMLAGWSSGSKYPLLGSVRASAQLISYEATLGLSLVAVVLVSGSLSTHDIVVQQAGR